ncbi:LptF/LptG family permease [Pseudokordiimonas caeni]|uniref:LptF/LptG family permease n=1 Tax=Pseudokordiimonas caeni TaxID=2997908 RepID=UPI0028112313|nr:LptF/LptG family permease [Pseudokordiimonas caeni]
MLTLIDRYVLRLVMTPLMTTLGIAALLLILERMLRLFDFVVNEGGPVGVVFEMLANLTPHYMGLALPIGLFLGILVAFRNLSLSSELDSLQTSGVGLGRLLRPVLMLSLLLMAVNVALVGWVQPHSRYAYRGLVYDLRSGALGASIRVGEFVEIGDDTVLRIEESHNQGSDLRGIFVERRDSRGSIAVSADRGGFFATSDEQTVMLRLYDGMLIDLNESQMKPRVLSFDQQDLTFRLPTGSSFRDRFGEELEMTLPELYRHQHDSSLPPESRQRMEANFHWRLMHSLTFLVLPLLAVPMGVTNKRATKATGFVVGLTLVIVYNELMEAMETLVIGGHSPFATIWLLFAGFTILSLYLFRVAAYKVGGDPLAWINGIWSSIKTPLIRTTRRLIGVKD